MRALLIGSLFAVGCVDAVDERWELAHDHVVAVRATPPAIMPGERAKLDALLAHADGPPTDGASPISVALGDPHDGVVTNTPDGWFFTAPDDAIAPVTLIMEFPGPLYATKIVNIGATATNPSVPAMVTDGQVVDDEITMPLDRDVHLSIAVEPGDRVNWFTSCGTVFQDDVPAAFVRVTASDRPEGQLAVVIRDPRGGVAWRIWSVIVR